MNDENKTRTTPGDGVRISSLVERREQVGSSRLSETFRARTVEGIDVLLLVFRHPFAEDSDAADRFLQRMDQMRRESPSTPTLVTHGIDENGVGFVLAEFVEGAPLLEQDKPHPNAEELFLSVVDIVADLHNKGLVVGDFSESTFVVDPQGKVRYLGILGDAALDAKKTSSLAPATSIYFCSPEQRDGAAASASSDVYGVGVLSYRLWTGTFPVSSDTVMHQSGTSGATLLTRSPSSVSPDVPLWVDSVLVRSMDRDISHRYQTVSELAEDIARFRGTAGQSAAFRERSQQLGADNAALRESVSGLDFSREDGSRSIGQQIALGVVLTVFLSLLVAVGVLFVVDKRPEPKTDPQDLLALQAEYSSDDVAAILKVLQDPKRPLEQREQALLRLAELPDRSVSDSLLTVLNGGIRPPDVERLQTAALKAYLLRLQHFGMQRTADVISSYASVLLSQRKELGKSGELYHALQAGEPFGDSGVRMAALDHVRRLDSRFGMQLAASMLFTQRMPTGVEGVFRQWVASEYHGDVSEARSIQALVISKPELVDLFDDLKETFIGQLASDELAWVLRRSSMFDSPVLHSVAAEMQKRSVLDRYHAIFLNVLVDTGRFGASKSLQRALVRGALGSLTELDATRFAEWNAPEATLTFLAACITIPSQPVALDFFDTLAARSIDLEPARSLMRWVRAKQWNRREQLVHPVAVLALHNVADQSDVTDAFRKLREISPDEEFFNFVFDSGADGFIEETVRQLSAEVPTEHLLALLNYRDKHVRMAAVRALRKTNELTVLQRIGRAYDREKDADVKAVYQQTHWFATRS